jgi:hypothetical protein
MDVTILSRIRQVFLEIPEKDERAKIGPQAFLIALITAMVTDSKSRSIANLRRQTMALLGKGIARSSYWQRLGNKRLTAFLVQSIRGLVARLAGKCGINEGFLEKIGVKGIYLLDASSVTLPNKARKDFPAPRTNVVPAAIKWHLCMNLLSGIGEWFSLTEATCHERNLFPPLKMLRGGLIIFDLGYWDYSLLAELINEGVFFLSRVKDKALIQITAIPANTRWKKPLGKYLFTLNWSKFNGNILDFVGTIHHGEMVYTDIRIIGFWNVAAKKYHWYATNLSVPSKPIYALYCLRWQVELLFKTGKSSLSLADAPSSSPRIIINIMLAAISANLIAQPLARMTLKNATEEIQESISVQRAGFIYVHLAAELARYLLSGMRKALNLVRKKLLCFITEFIDPNWNSRPTSMKKAAIFFK